MKKLLFFTVLASLLGAVALQARPMDRGLGNPHSVFIPKGSVAFGLAGGYNRYNATGENANPGATLVGLVTDLNGNARLASASALFSYFVADNMSLGLRATYNNTAIDLNSASAMSLLSLGNKHSVNETLTASITFRRYMPMFNSKVVALFAEARLNGGFGYGKDYENTDRGKVGTYTDIYSVSAGVHLGIMVFVTDFLGVEVSLPMLEGGYEWDLQTTGGTRDSSLSHAFGSYKPNLLGINLGLVFHF